MIYLAVDKDGTEKISNSPMIRRTGIDAICWGLVKVFYKKNERYKWADSWCWYSKDTGTLPFNGTILPKGTIEKITGIKLTWKDEPLIIDNHGILSSR